jgi:uncharacterized protein
MKRLTRLVTHWGLVIHIYLSMAGFALTLLFALTGLTLNHQDFGAGEPVLTTSMVDVPADLSARGGEDVVAPWLKGQMNISMPLSSYRADEQQIQATFAAPGHRTVVTIDRQAHTGQVESETRGLLGKLDDLHKGFDSGPVWYWIIDLTAVLLTISALSGMMTLAGLRHRRATGFLWGGLGLVTLAAIYVVFVPR